MRLPKKVSVVGVGISTTTYSDAVCACRDLIESAREGALPDPHRGQYVCVISVHGLVLAQFDAKLRSLLNRAVMATPDGMPVVWALRSFGISGQTRVYGPDLMLAVLSEAERVGHRVFLYGGRPDALAMLASRLKSRYPELQIVGSFSPPFRAMTAEEDQAATSLIQDAEPDLVFVGLSTPKQERWMAEHAAALPRSVLIGVGAAFDFHAGRVRQAPAWMQGAGLEWLFRLLTEPRRLWKRYLLITPIFLPLWAMQKLGIRNVHSEAAHADH